ncbi:MAG: hypothetical protein ACKVX9_05295 [Blastocatellia bacterium]
MAKRNEPEQMNNAGEAGDFQQKEQELMEQIHRRMALRAEREELAAVTGVSDEEILATLQEMGYTRKTVRLLYLVPLVQVAWASGSVTEHEREMVLEAADLCGALEDSQIHHQMLSWLEERPEQAFFDRTLRVISDILATLPPEKREAGRSSLVTFCANVAAASGGILGFGSKVSAAEQEVIERIAAELEWGHPAAARQMIEDF